MFQKNLVFLALAFGAFQVSDAEACMPSRDPKTGVVHCPRISIAESKITAIETLNQAHSGLRGIVGENLTVDFTKKEISMPVDAICPSGAYCILPVFEKKFRIVSDQTDAEGTRVLFGTEIKPVSGTTATIKVKDFTGARALFVPAMTIVEYSTRAIAPKARKKTSVLYGNALQYLPTIQLAE
ncbi:MAG: hypothetical protein JNL01_11845 [Bdellovibrionales bacterium]|nr:hypothetical protein [Bdellovibrionales bacterium]